MARNWFLLTVFGFVLGGSLIFALWWAYRRFLLHHQQPLQPAMPKWKASSIRNRFGFWRRKSAQKEYELVSRHEV